MTDSPPIKILILGQDPDVFPRQGSAPNDTYARHLGYAREVLRRRPGSQVRIAVHTRRGGPVYAAPINGLELFGTASASRLHAPLGLFRLLRRFRMEGWVPDLISCQTAYEEGIIALAARDPRSRLQVQEHSDPYGRGFRRGRLLNRVRGYLARFVVRRADHVRVVSAGVADTLARSGDAPGDRIQIAPVPVSFTALPRSVDPAQPMVLFVGRLSPEKDIADTWVATARAIHRCVPSARFVIAGEGPERAAIERAAADLGDAVSMPGAVGYDALPALFAQASVFLFTSQFEGLGRVVIEAMLAGVPVVSTDIVGPRDLIDDGRTGYLVERDADALAARCVELLENPETAALIGEAGRAWARENYAYENVVSRLVSGWESAAEIKRRKA